MLSSSMRLKKKIVEYYLYCEHAQWAAQYLSCPRFLCYHFGDKSSEVAFFQYLIPSSMRTYVVSVKYLLLKSFTAWFMQWLCELLTTHRSCLPRPFRVTHKSISHRETQIKPDIKDIIRTILIPSFK